jgi:lipoate-protein ligase A
MAIDESIIESIHKAAAEPTLRFYRWKPSAVSIGTFQGMEDEVDIEYCRKRGIDPVRRITGGGAVYHDYNGEITYSIIIPQSHKLVPQDILESYSIICDSIIRGLAELDIQAEFVPINDIAVNGKKISGNAQTRRKGCLLQHGTILLDLEVREMFRVLRVPQEKISDKMIDDVTQRVTSLKDILGRKVQFEEISRALQKGFTDALDIELAPGSLSSDEVEAAKKLAKKKYSTDDWNFSR